MKVENRWINIEPPLLSKGIFSPMIRKQIKTIVSKFMKIFGPERNDGRYNTTSAWRGASCCMQLKCHEKQSSCPVPVTRIKTVAQFYWTSLASAFGFILKGQLQYSQISHCFQMF
jgi:hypothetical protein